MVMIRGVGGLVLVVGLVLLPGSGSSQTTLDDVVIRAFDINVSISPVPLKYEFVGGDLRFTSRGTLRGTTTAMLEVTAPSPVSTARFFFDSDVKLTSVKAADYQTTFERERDTLTLTFAPALPHCTLISTAIATSRRALIRPSPTLSIRRVRSTGSAAATRSSVW